MTLGRKGLTSGVIKGLTVCCITMSFVLLTAAQTLKHHYYADQYKAVCRC
ncbi:unnamed protein product [Staurois parvus]|uniref:Uncharacterized protein n=1 Tax=Staurois parvus TaxID=386267 RepID=A0ABN9GDC8_9NEOB|nr:unnamed protein product [Staurois parvus]